MDPQYESSEGASMGLRQGGWGNPNAFDKAHRVLYFKNWLIFYLDRQPYWFCFYSLLYYFKLVLTFISIDWFSRLALRL